MEEINLANEKPDIRKILLIGNEGTGKTHFIGTMPKPIYIFSFDKGYLTLAGQEGVTVGLCMDDDRYNPKAFLEFRKKFDELRKSPGKYKTIAIDSLSFLSTFLYDHEQKVNNTTDKPAGYGPYMNVKSKLQDIVNQAVKMAEYVVCTALVEATKDDITGEIFFVPSLVGSMKNEIGAWFDAVFYMGVDKDTNGGKTYKMLTVGDRRQKAKIRLPSTVGNRISAVEKPDFGELMKKIGGR